MATRRTAIREAALKLPVDERARLAKELIESLDEGEEQDLGWGDAWTAEIARRSREIREGTVAFVDGETALREIEENLRARGKASRPASKSKSTPRRRRK